MTSHDWLFDLMGFGEDGYESTRRRLAVDGDELTSTVTGKRYGIGELTLPTLAELRSRVNPTGRSRSTVTCVVGDARAMHAEPDLAGALFQVASQFNVLEMVSEHVTPEQGRPLGAVVGVAGAAGEPGRPLPRPEPPCHWADAFAPGRFRR